MKKILLGLVICAGFAACTNDYVDVINKDTVQIDGSGYISFAINLPTQTATRAANDNYDDGLESEYAVYDATLFLFGGESESTATYYASYSLTPDGWNMYEGSNDNITSKKQFTQEIDTPESGYIYALVVLNSNGLMSNLTVGTTLSDLQTTVMNLGGVAAMTDTGFFMANAPLINTSGGATDPTGGVVTTLTPIDIDNIYTSASEAEAHPATEIYVERGMAKVTVTDSTSGSTEEGDIPAQLEGFVLDITNNVTYLVRNTTGNEEWWGYNNGYSNNYRMAGNVLVAADLYRTYWATDPNYDVYPYSGGEEGARDYGGVMTSIAGTTPELTSLDDPAYCLENTFNVRHQNQDETTRVIVAATLYDGVDFYIWDNNKLVAYTNVEDIEALILTQMHADGYLEEAEAAWVGPDPGVSDMYEYITIVIDDSAASDDVAFTYVVSDEVVADWFVDPDDRTVPLGYVPAAMQNGSEAHAEVEASINAAHQIAYYENGMSYYPVLIEHFGGDLAYWSMDIIDMGATDANLRSYPDGVWGYTAEQNWLGRYGVLRNNWYDINVTGVRTIGSATVPTAYGDPDDPTNTWISIEVNILSWAKRTQNAEF